MVIKRMLWLAFFRGEEIHGFYLFFDIRGFEACNARSLPSRDREMESEVAPSIASEMETPRA